jgi:predicted PurR-regulated permease PerM
MATQLEWERRIGYGVLLAAALLLTGRVLGGIWEALLLAAVLAAGLSPVQERLTAALGNRPTVSALGLTVGTLLFLLVPLTLLVIYLVGQAIHLVQHVREIASRSGPEEVIQALPDRLEQIVRMALSHFDMAKLGEQLRTRGVNALVSLRGAMSAMGAFGVQLGLLLIALFLFLSRSKQVAEWLRTSVPVAPADVDLLVSDFRAVARNVIGSTVVTATVQTIVATIGYYIAGVPTPILFGALTFLAAFIPGLGTPVVGLPLAVFQYFYCRHWQGIFLAIWKKW